MIENADWAKTISTFLYNIDVADYLSIITHICYKQSQCSKVLEITFTYV